MSIPRSFAHLVDDAAIFPPGLMPLPDAVVAHAGHLSSAHADLVGPFVVDEARLDELVSLTDEGFVTSVVVSDSADVGGVVVRAMAGGLDLAGLEVKLDLDTSLLAQVDGIAAVAPAGVSTYVEAPPPGHPEWPRLLDAVARGGLRMKFRTGGTEAAAFPTEAELAAWIVDATAAGVPFKCTAGLHHATRHSGVETGFEHHGYLNILVASAHAAAGADRSEVARVLAERDGPSLASAVANLPDEQLVDARSAFTSYGSCSILEPLVDLTELHLIARA